jgi:hypothetical protein
VLDDAGQQLAHRLRSVIARGGAIPLADTEFDALARDTFAYQFARVPVYGAYCRRRGHTPEGVARWQDVPAVPVAAFAEARLCAVRPEATEAIFRTSGTSRGGQRRGEHHVAELELYRDALLASFAAFMLPDGARLPILSLVAAPELLPDSSLSCMAATATERLGAEGGGFFAHPEEGLAVAPLLDRLSAAERTGSAVLLFGTAFSFVHLLDELSARAVTLRLPPGSRIMDTGGYKGRSREVPPAALRGLYRERFGVPETHCVNEYGMTEMLSQFYEPALRAEVTTGEPARLKVAAPWVRSQAMDPETLRALPDGDVGILKHVDLANIGSVSALQTEDLGRVMAGRVELLGRVPGATPRGCSIALDMLLEARRTE